MMRALGAISPPFVLSLSKYVRQRTTSFDKRRMNVVEAQQ